MTAKECKRFNVEVTRRLKKTYKLNVFEQFSSGAFSEFSCRRSRRSSWEKLQKGWQNGPDPPGGKTSCPGTPIGSTPCKNRQTFQ